MQTPTSEQLVQDKTTLEESSVMHVTGKECEENQEVYSTSKVMHTEKNSSRSNGVMLAVSHKFSCTTYR